MYPPLHHNVQLSPVVHVQEDKSSEGFQCQHFLNLKLGSQFSLIPLTQAGTGGRSSAAAGNSEEPGGSCPEAGALPIRAHPGRRPLLYPAPECAVPHAPLHPPIPLTGAS